MSFTILGRLKLSNSVIVNVPSSVKVLFICAETELEVDDIPNHQYTFKIEKNKVDTDFFLILKTKNINHR